MARKKITNIRKSEEILVKTRKITSGWQAELQKCINLKNQNKFKA